MDTTEIIEAIDAEIQRLQEAKALLGDGPASKKTPTKRRGSVSSGKRTLSAAGRARIAAAQKARWAKKKAEK